MDWTHILSSAGGAILGGGMAGVGAYYRAKADRTTQAKEMSELRNDVNGFKDSCTACRGELREDIGAVKDSIDAHHADSERHISSGFERMMTQRWTEIAARLQSIEEYLRNGGGKKG